MEALEKEKWYQKIVEKYSQYKFEVLKEDKEESK